MLSYARARESRETRVQGDYSIPKRSVSELSQFRINMTSQKNKRVRKRVYTARPATLGLVSTVASTKKTIRSGPRSCSYEEA